MVPSNTILDGLAYRRRRRRRRSSSSSSSSSSKNPVIIIIDWSTRRHRLPRSSDGTSMDPLIFVIDTSARHHSSMDSIIIFKEGLTCRCHCCNGMLQAKLGGDVHHRVASRTNYTQEGINSKISENNRLRKRSLVQLATLMSPCCVASASIPGPETCF